MVTAIAKELLNTQGVRNAHKDLYGDAKGIFGEASEIFGDCSGISGDVTGLIGDVTRFTCNVLTMYGNVAKYENDGRLKKRW